MYAREMIRTHPDVQGNMSEALVQCLEECYACAQTCTACADACLAEAMVDQLKQCIRLNLDCADVCAATGALASRRTGSQSGDPASNARGLRSRLPCLWRGVRASRPSA